MQPAYVAALFLLGLSVGVECLILSRLQSENKVKSLKNITALHTLNLPPRLSFFELSFQEAGMDSPLHQENGQKVMEWAEQHVEDVGEMSNTALWPELTTAGRWDSGLQDPQVYVVSMKEDTHRRTGFAKEFSNLSMKLSPGSARWALGINVSAMPQELRNPNGANATGAESFFNKEENMGAFGCFVAHLRIFREHHQRCADCDMVIFEDDVGFRPKFEQLWTEFYNSLPEALPLDGRPDNKNASNWRAPALLHIGGDSLWTKPMLETTNYMQVSWLSRTWGYVVKAHAVKLIMDILAKSDDGLNQAIDQQMRGEDQGKKKYVVVAPKLPLVMAQPLCGSHTTYNDGYGSAEKTCSEEAKIDWSLACWGRPQRCDVEEW